MAFDDLATPASRAGTHDCSCPLRQTSGKSPPLILLSCLFFPFVSEQPSPLLGPKQIAMPLAMAATRNRRVTLVFDF
jgi:hypothetical protein